MDILDFQKYKAQRTRNYEVAWRTTNNLTEHKTVVPAHSRDAAESLFRVLFPILNIKINHVVVDETLRKFHVQMSLGKQKFQGKLLARNEKQAKEIVCDRFKNLYLDYLEEEDAGGVL